MSRLLASPPPIAVSRSAFWHSSPTDGSGLLAITDAVGSSTWRAGAAILWIASVGDTASTYDFHVTDGKTILCKNRLHVFTWLFHIPNMLIYLSFRAQDHNKVAGWDTTSLTPSWTRQEDPVATTRRRSFRFSCLLNCQEDLCIVEHLCVWSCELILFSFVMNLCWRCRNILYCACFGGSRFREVAKIGSSKKIPIFIG
jgi:hypothetical protein